MQRFRAGFTAIPAMAELGRVWERDVLGACRTAVSTGYVLAAELRAHGVDFTFAPVLDLDWQHNAVIGDRAAKPRRQLRLRGFDPALVGPLRLHIGVSRHQIGN